MSIAIQTSPRLTPRNHPPRADVRAFWAAAAALNHSPQARRWLGGRGLSSLDLQALDLARVVPNRRCIPSWMRGGRAHCVMLPLYNAMGELASVRLRDPRRPRFRGVPKGYSLKGAVMANAAALAMLRDGVTPSRLIICEGETDFLTVAMLAGTSDIAVIGVSSGSWTPDIAARVPNRVQVHLWTDHDPAGDRYADAIARTLHPRCMVVRSLETPHDVNALWKLGELPADLARPSRLHVPSVATPTKPRPEIQRPHQRAEDIEGARREAIRRTALEKLRETLEWPQRHERALRAGLICGNFIDVLTRADVKQAELDLIALSETDREDTSRTFRDGITYGSAPGRRYVPENRPAPLIKTRNKATATNSNASNAQIKGQSSAHPRDLTEDEEQIASKVEKLELEEVEPGVFEVCARYFNAEWLVGLAEGVLKLHGPHGTGKTTAISTLIRAFGGDAIYIGPRVELCRTAGSRDMGLDFYQDVHVDTSTAKRLAICLDSILKINIANPDDTPRRFKVLVLDEVEQLAHHLFGGTIGARSYNVFDQLRMLIQQSDCVVLSDADIGPMTEALLDAVLVDVSEDERPNIRTLRNTYKHKRTARFVQNRQECFAQLVHALLRGEKVAAACTSAKMAERFNAMLSGQKLDGEGAEVRTLLNLLHEQRPGLKTLLVTAENKGEKNVQEFLPDPDAVVSDYDVVLFSSAIGTGYSITSRGFRSFLFAAANGPDHGVNAHAALQMIWRFRNPLDDEWTVWAEERTFQTPEDVDTLRRTMLTERSMTNNIIAMKTRAVGGRIEREALDDTHFELYLRVQTRHNALCNNMYGALREHMTCHGVTIVDVEPELDDNTVKALRKVEKTVRENLINEHVKELMEEPDRPFEALEEIRQRGPRDKSERRAIERDRITHALEDDIHEQDAREFVESNGACISRGRRLAETLLALFGEADAIAHKASFINLRSSYATHLQAHPTRAVILAELLNIAGFDPRDPLSFRMDSPELRKRFVPWVKLHRDHIRAAGVNPDNKDLEKSPTKIVKAALSRLGVKTVKIEQTRRDGTPVRFYGIEPESWARGMRWARVPLRQAIPHLTVTDPAILLNTGDLCDAESPPPPRE